MIELTRYNLETIGMIQDGKLTPDEIQQILQNQKLRELIENYIENFTKNPSWSSVEIMREELQKLLEESKE